MSFDSKGQPRPQPVAKCVCVELTSEDTIGRGLEGVHECYDPC